MKKIILGLLGILLVGVLAGYGIGWFSQQPQQDVEDVRVVVSEEIPMRGVQLYFTAPEGTFLVPETRDVPICDDDSLCIRNLLNGLIDGSQLGNVAILPKETKILGVEIENDLIRVNFSRQLIDFHPGGSLSELLTVYGLINTLNENFSYIRQLQILVEGEIRQTLKGHVRIDQPVYADYSFNRSSLNVAASSADSAEKGLSIEKILEKVSPAGEN